MDAKPRYRMEDGRPCVDVRAASIERLFDNRDPAPFRERDLDPDLVDYLHGASEDLASHRGFHVVFWVEKPCERAEIETAFRAHFAYEIERRTRARRRQRGVGLVALGIAVAAIGVLLAAAPLVEGLVGGWLGGALRETLTISSWVLMWRPVDALVYDWIPFRRERAAMRRLESAPIDLRIGKGPDPA